MLGDEWDQRKDYNLEQLFGEGSRKDNAGAGWTLPIPEDGNSNLFAPQLNNN